MNNSVGIWLDHHRAYIVHVFDDELRAEVVDSEASPHIRPQGGYGSGRSGSPQDVMKESSFQARIEHALDKYYKEIIERLDGTKRVFIFGPGQARIELAKALSETNTFQGRIDDIRPADKMTDRQIVATVRDHFRIPDDVPIR